jgi:hypothetical protein
VVSRSKRVGKTLVAVETVEASALAVIRVDPCRPVVAHVFGVDRDVACFAEDVMFGNLSRMRECGRDLHRGGVRWWTKAKARDRW